MTNEEQIIKFKKAIEFYESNKENSTTSNSENIVKLKKAIEILERKGSSNHTAKEPSPEHKFNYAPMIVFWGAIAMILFLFISNWINNYNEKTTEIENAIRAEKIKNDSKNLSPAEVDSLVKKDYPQLYEELEKK